MVSDLSAIVRNMQAIFLKIKEIQFEEALNVFKQSIFTSLIFTVIDFGFKYIVHIKCLVVYSLVLL